MAGNQTSKPGQTLHIGPDWLPTADNVNALPDPLRQYIFALETRDPSDMVRENVILRALREELIAKIAELKSEREG